MRVMLIVIAGLFLLAAPVAAHAKDGAQPPAKLVKMFGEWMKKAGTQLSATGNTIEPAFVDGTGNTVFNIDKIEISFDIGDVAINEGDEESNEGGDELAHRLLDLLGERMMSGGGMPHPPITVAPGGMQDLPGEMPGEMHGKMHGKMRGEMRGEMHPKPDMPSGIHRGGPGMPGEMHFEQFSGTPERQQVFEMFQMIPPDVDPGFFEFMLHVGELAWEYPEFREHLEKLVDKAQERLE